MKQELYFKFSIRIDVLISMEEKFGEWSSTQVYQDEVHWYQNIMSGIGEKAPFSLGFPFLGKQSERDDGLKHGVKD
jgi:hypothetical protein